MKAFTTLSSLKKWDFLTVTMVFSKIFIFFISLIFPFLIYFAEINHNIIASQYSDIKEYSDIDNIITLCLNN